MVVDDDGSIHSEDNVFFKDSVLSVVGVCHLCHPKFNPHFRDPLSRQIPDISSLHIIEASAKNRTHKHNNDQLNGKHDEHDLNRLTVYYVESKF